MIFAHRPLTRLALLCAISATCSFAQPSSPAPAEIAQLRAMSELDPKIQADGEPWSIDPTSREAARQFFRTIYGVSEGVPSGWNGTTASGVPGTTSAAFKEAVRNRVNFYRAYAGVPANVSMNATFSAKAQQAAMMMSANNALSHFPPTSWTHYSADGAEAAGKSNIGIGTFGTDTMDGYMRDHGNGNETVGHRRWILYPQTREMGTGDVEAQGSLSPANALWVQDAQIFAARPTTRDELVAWPPKGNVPYQLIWPRWSVSLAGADFSAATVSMTRNGAPITATIEARTGGGGAPEPTLIWLYDGKTGNDLASHDRPSADVAYDVTVSNVVVGGSARSFTYKVTVFDPDIAGSDFTATSISGTTTPDAGKANAYTVAVPSFASGFQWRELGVNPNGNGLWNAEGGLRGEIDGTSSAYPLIVSGPTAGGSGAYHLAHPTTAQQTLTLPDTYAVPPTGEGSLAFDSKLGFASTGQVARAEISINDGQSWTTVYEKRGGGSNSSPTESAYQNHSIPFTNFAGQTIRVRFSYTHEGGSFFPQTDPNVGGWLVDNIRITAAMSVVPVSTSAHLTGSSFDYSPASEGIKILQARGMFFGNYGMDWGPIKNVVAQAATTGGGGNGGNTGGSSRIINLSVRANAAAGVDALNVGMVVGGSGSKPLLMRVVGPTLGQAPFNLPGTAPDPALQVFTSGTVVAENDNWSNTLTSSFNAVGAFALVNGSKDAALLTTLPNGPHPALVNTKGQSGVVILEAYDMESVTSGTARLVNVSARNQVGTGSDVLIAGFVIGGTGNKTLLIRGVGATLGQAPFNLPGVLANPQLVIKPLGSETVVASNDNWNNDVQITSVASTLGAFALSSTNDAAVLVTLAPGGYTATVSGVNNTTGIAIVEIYEVE